VRKLSKVAAKHPEIPRVRLVAILERIGTISDLLIAAQISANEIRKGRNDTCRLQSNYY